MPTGVRKNASRCGTRGWEIYKKDTGEHVGCSKTKRDAHIAAWKRDSADKAKRKGK